MSTKEKRSWLHSLTRRKKSQAPSPESNVLNDEDAEQMQNNNNETTGTVNHHLIHQEQLQQHQQCRNGPTMIRVNQSRKRNEEKNIFQRIRKKMEQPFRSIHNHYNNLSGRDVNSDTAGGSGTTDASSEFQTHSPQQIHQPTAHEHPELKFSFSRQSQSALDEAEIVPFTHDYGRFIVKKWLERESGPNRVMYKACSEMLSQVWYWGEISRRDAQKQLTDKPTGSFLVRDSETSGCQFTLSFRTVNITLHYRLEYRDNYWHFEELQYESIVEMIEDILFRCTRKDFVCFVRVPNEMQPPLPVILKYPLSRYLKMPQLQDMCRRVIQKHASIEQIAKLPIPPKLLEYLSETRELVFQT